MPSTAYSLRFPSSRLKDRSIWPLSWSKVSTETSTPPTLVCALASTPSPPCWLMSKPKTWPPSCVVSTAPRPGDAAQATGAIESDANAPRVMPNDRATLRMDASRRTSAEDAVGARIVAAGCPARNALGVRASGALLPLDRRGRFAADVIHHARNPAHFVDDAQADTLEEFIRQVRPARRHEVDGLDRAQRDHPFVGAAVAHHAHRFHRQEYREGLADLVVPAGSAQFFDEDAVALLQELRMLALHLAQDAHAQARARERMAIDHFARQPEFHADAPHLVLEQFTQWLEQLHLHTFRQAADVVMAFDDMRLAGLRTGRFDDIRIDGALRQPLHAPKLARFLVEDIDEELADHLALLLRIFDAAQGIEKAMRSIDADHAHAHVPRHRVHYLVALARTQQAGVHEHAGQLIADCLFQQRRDDRRIHATGQAQQHLVVADLRAHARDRIVDDVGAGPQRGATADVGHEAAQDLRAVFRVRDFRVELDTVATVRFVRGRGDRHGFGGSDQLETARQRGDAVAVRHPHVLRRVVRLEPAEQARMRSRLDPGVAEFASVAAFHRAPELHGHRLQAVADAQQRHAEIEDSLRDARRARRDRGFRTAGKDDPLRRKLRDLLRRVVPGPDLAIHADLAHPSRDQLRVLRTEVEDEDLVGVDVLHARLSHSSGSSALPW